MSELNIPGFIRFSIKAKDTPENESVHKAFKEFCKVEVDDNYTLGLRKLLEFYQGDFKFEMLHQDIADLQIQVEELRQKLEEPKDEPKPGVF